MMTKQWNDPARRARASNVGLGTVVRAHEILEGIPPEDRDWLCAILRRTIAGLSPEQAAEAIGDLFHEIHTLDQTVLEECAGAELKSTKAPVT